MPVMSKRTFTEILKAKKLYLPILSHSFKKENNVLSAIIVLDELLLNTGTAHLKVQQQQLI